jgi:hypothetical protein
MHTNNFKRSTPFVDEGQAIFVTVGGNGNGDGVRRMTSGRMFSGRSDHRPEMIKTIGVGTMVE